MKRVIHFTRLRYLMIGLSLLLILGGGAGLYLKGGFNLGIDFTAGLTERIQIKDQEARVSIEEVRQVLSGIGQFNLQMIGRPEDQEFIVKVIAPGDEPGFQERMEAQILRLLSESFGQENVSIKQSDFVGPRYSQDLVGQTVSIILVALVLILLYTAFRFHFIYAAAAVICLVHDVLIMFGVLAVFQLELTTTTIAAILTIIGYSLNDTIVIFDRMRENNTLMRDAEFVLIVNSSITQSLSRTLLTSLTTLIAVLAIYIFGSGSIKLFALNLMIGVVVGTYSTIFIASPIVLAWQGAVERARKSRDLQRYGRKAGTAGLAGKAVPAKPAGAGIPSATGVAKLPAAGPAGDKALPEPPDSTLPATSPAPGGPADPAAAVPAATTDTAKDGQTVTRIQPSRAKSRKKKKKRKR